MKEQRITVDIDPDGSITADADGFTGDACLRELERLLEGLGPGKPPVKRKPDAAAARTAAARTQVAGRKP